MAIEYSLYKDFLIVVYSVHDVRAYRCYVYHADGFPSYAAPDLETIKRAINDADDVGGFTEAEYNKLMQELGRAEPRRYGAYSPEKTREIAVHMRDDPGVVAEAMYRHGTITEEEKPGFSEAVRSIATDWLIKFR